MYNAEYNNKVVYPKGSSANVRDLPATTAKTILKIYPGMSAGRASGNYQVWKDGTWLQVNLYNPIDGRKYGWVRSDVVALKAPQASPSAEANAETLIQDLAKSDVAVYENLLRISKAIYLLKKKGHYTEGYEDQRNQMIARLAKRQARILSDPDLRADKTIPTPFKLQGQTVSGSDEIGIIPLVVVAVVVIVTLAAAAAVYYAFKPDYEDSKMDFKLSNELDQKLQKVLTVPEYNQLKEEAQAQIETAYNEGKKDQKWDDFGGTIKIVLYGALGFIVVTKVVDAVNSSRKKA